MWPVRGQKPWDDALKAYIDDDDADPRFGTAGGVDNVSNYSTITANRALGKAAWYAPPPSVDGGTNYGWQFAAVPTVDGRMFLVMI